MLKFAFMYVGRLFDEIKLIN